MRGSLSSQSYFVYFWLRWVFIAVGRLFSSCGKWGLLSSFSAWLLIAVASLVAQLVKNLPAVLPSDRDLFPLTFSCRFSPGLLLLGKTLESPLDCKEIQPVHSKGNQSWVFFGRNDAKAETPVLWPPHVKSCKLEAVLPWFLRSLPFRHVSVQGGPQVKSCRHSVACLKSQSLFPQENQEASRVEGPGSPSAQWGGVMFEQIGRAHV